MYKKFFVSGFSVVVACILAITAVYAYYVYGSGTLNGDQTKLVNALNTNTEYVYGTFVSLRPSESNFLSTSATLVLNVNGGERTFDVDSTQTVKNPNGDMDLSSLTLGEGIFVYRNGAGGYDLVSLRNSSTPQYDIGIILAHGTSYGVAGTTCEVKMLTQSSGVMIYQIDRHFTLNEADYLLAEGWYSSYLSSVGEPLFIEYKLNSSNQISNINMFSQASANAAVYNANAMTMGSYNLRDESDVVFFTKVRGEFDGGLENFDSADNNYSMRKLIDGFSYDVDVYQKTDGTNYFVVAGINSQTNICSGIVSSIGSIGDCLYVDIYDIGKDEIFSCSYNQSDNTYTAFHTGSPNYEDFMTYKPAPSGLLQALQALRVGMAVNFSDDLKYIEVVNEDAADSGTYTASLDFDVANRGHVSGSLQAQNLAAEDREFSVYLALYDEAKIINMDQSGTRLSQWETALLGVAIQPTNLINGKSYQAKLFCWDEDLKPIAFKERQI